MGHNYIRWTPQCHNYIGHNYIGHNYPVFIVMANIVMAYIGDSLHSYGLHACMVSLHCMVYALCYGAVQWQRTASNTRINARGRHADT